MMKSITVIIKRISAIIHGSKSGSRLSGKIHINYI
jgi:hypothetical protein